MTDNDDVLGDVEDAADLAVEGLVGHTLLESSVTLDINNVSNFVGFLNKDFQLKFST